MTEIIFIVEKSAEGGFEAKALGESIFTDGETIGTFMKELVVLIPFSINNI